VSVILGGAGENNQDQIQVHAAGANRAEPLSAGISLAQLVKKDEETLKKIVAEDAPTKETKELKDSRESKETKKIKKDLASPLAPKKILYIDFFIVMWTV
jgi:hypothetical protein